MKAACLLLALLVQEDPLRVSWGRVQSVDPALAVSPGDQRIAEALFVPFPFPEGKAEGNVVTIRIAGAAWTDGRPVTAEDFRFAWMRCLDPSTGSPWSGWLRPVRNAAAWREGRILAGQLLEYETRSANDRREIVRRARASGTREHAELLKRVAPGEKEEDLRAALAQAIPACAGRPGITPADVGIEVIDGSTLRVTLTGGAGAFVAALARAPLAPVPSHVVTERRGAWSGPEGIVTCGAYGVARWRSEEMILERRPGAPGPERVFVRMFDRVGEAWPLYEREGLDWVEPHLVPPEKLESLYKEGHVRAATSAALVYLRLNPSGALKDRAARGAIARSVDRESIAARAGYGAAEARTLLRGSKVAAPGRDPAEAMAGLLSVWPDLAEAPRLNLLYWSDPAIEPAAKAVRDQLQSDLALKVRVDIREWPAFRAAVAAGEFDAALDLWVPEAGGDGPLLEEFPDGARRGEAGILAESLAVPLYRPGIFFVAKPHVLAVPGMSLSQVRIRR